MAKREARPPFIIASRSVPERRHNYPSSDEFTGCRRDIGVAAGLVKIGVNLMRLPPGERSSWPHAEEKEEEFVYVIEGNVGAWIDGVLHPLRAGDFAAFPAGTGIAHCFINNSRRDALLLVGGEASRRDNRIVYPLHPGRRDDMPWSGWWDDAPARTLGPHDGLPNLLRVKLARAAKQAEEKPATGEARAAHPARRAKPGVARGKRAARRS